METESYYARMYETARFMDEALLKAIQPLHELDEAVFPLASHLVLLRASNGRPKLRYGLVRAAYELCGGTDWKRDLVPACVAAELLNISTYVFNRIFDEKGGTKWSRMSVANQSVAGMLLRELVERAIAESEYASELKAKILALLSELHFTLWNGFFLDLNRFEIEKVSSLSEAEYFALYEKKCADIAGAFGGKLAEIGARIAGASDEQIEAVSKAGLLFFTAIQSTNDMADFVVPAEGEVFKSYKDQFSDLLHGKAFLPVYHVLRHGSASDKSFLLSFVGKESFTTEEIVRLNRLMVSSGAVEVSKRFTVQKVHAARKELNIFPKTDARGFFKYMIAGVRSSKFWKGFPS
ncbi:MAG: polyprenyl synthetase family protein [Candidatus Diapherotrites archaeon]